MIFLTSKNSLGNPRVTFSRLGYHLGNNNSFERRLGGNQFPRFHVYLEERESDVRLSIHLDLKPHTYSGFSAHVGDYESEDVAKELNRIKAFLGV